ncbi:hypothetical protein [Streptomyces sp. GMY02]|uniref:hypothetical protein n=1 Tax=Streptomyces sp. GMY02 TaxID=1333528 RepID=UPI0020B8A605|nr:hypothetical protein [Streptomyces sp. GMY02]
MAHGVEYGGAVARAVEIEDEMLMGERRAAYGGDGQRPGDGAQTGAGAGAGACAPGWCCMVRVPSLPVRGVGP